MKLTVCLVCRQKYYFWRDPEYFGLRPRIRRAYRALRRPTVVTPIYPKAQAPMTVATHEAANERTERWKQRALDARAERDALAKELKELKDGR